MGNIIFVHGTGVRQPSYEKTFQKINDSAKVEGYRCEKCVWGAVHGAGLLEGGGSIPGYSGKAAAPSEPPAEALKWNLLYQNPRFELESLNERTDRQPPPRLRGEWQAKMKEIAAWEASPESEALLKEHRLDSLWRAAFEGLTKSDVWIKTGPPKSADVGTFFPAFCRCTAEAVMAETALGALSEGIPIPTAEIRDRIVGGFLIDLGAKVRGLDDWFNALGRGIKSVLLTTYAAGDYALSKVVTTPVVRNFVTDLSLEAIGDILFYQARGEKIRDFIEAEINRRDPPIFLLAHSLGGIACVDLLVDKKELQPRVAGLITAGTQAPLFYEMNCLVKLPRTAAAPSPGLPPHFPPWLNFHDPNDYLSYAAKVVFHDDARITDQEITSRQPRLMAHSAYWSEPKLWAKVAGFIREHGGSAG